MLWVCFFFSRTSAEQGNGASADTVSNYSRPSRVKKYQDTESELSYHSGVSSSNSYTQQNLSASQQFPQPYAPYPVYPPMGLPMGPPMVMPYPTKHRSGSSIGSHDGMQPGWFTVPDNMWIFLQVFPCPTPTAYPMPPYGPFGMYPAPMPGYGGYYPPGQYPPYPPVCIRIPKNNGKTVKMCGCFAVLQLGYYHPRTTEERMHMAELQKGAVMNRHYPMHGARRHGKREMVCFVCVHVCVYVCMCVLIEIPHLPHLSVYRVLNLSQDYLVPVETNSIHCVI